ncbi:MAG: hypothetical protein HQ512_06115 [Rhodospirillales bacterium]|nr:hypothetical protein [Rhodospirillales bacterium]
MTKKQGFHEDFGRDDHVKTGSERSFGVVFAVVFAVIGLSPLIGAEVGSGAVRVWALAVAGGFLTAGLFMPAVLRPLNLLWFKFGMVLSKIINPVVMGLLFYLTITPIALLMRLFGKDPLHRRFNANTKSYWIVRDPAGPEPESMRRQF